MAAFCTSCGTPLNESSAFCHSCGSKVTNAHKPVSQAPVHPIEEKVFMPNVGGVSVTNTRLVVYNKTYALANVSSVGLEKRKPHIILGCVMLWVGFVAFGAGVSHLPSGMGWLVGGIVLFGAGVLLVRMREYIVRLRTAGGESNALKSSNGEFAKQVVQAIEQAIVSRG